MEFGGLSLRALRDKRPLCQDLASSQSSLAPQEAAFCARPDAAGVSPLLEHASSAARLRRPILQLGTSPPAGPLGFQRTPAAASPLSSSPVGFDATGGLQKKPWRSGGRGGVGALREGEPSSLRQASFRQDGASAHVAVCAAIRGGTEPSVEPRTSETLLFPGFPWRTSTSKKAVSAGSQPPRRSTPPRITPRITCDSLARAGPISRTRLFGEQWRSLRTLLPCCNSLLHIRLHCSALSSKCSDNRMADALCMGLVVRLRLMYELQVEERADVEERLEAAPLKTQEDVLLAHYVPTYVMLPVSGPLHIAATF